MRPHPASDKHSAMTARFVPFFAVLSLAGACDRSQAPSQETPAPSASVATIGVALGTCDDLASCEKECADGSADRCRRLAATYAFGKGVERDEARATTIYARACEMGDAPACVFAGQMNEYAHGVPKDDSAAARFYGRACDLAWAPGCYNYAIMIENGRGVPEDPRKAAQLYTMACEAGARPACPKARDWHD
jgi:uncharacterized protein